MNATKITPTPGKIHGLRVILDQVIINSTGSKIVYQDEEYFNKYNSIYVTNSLTHTFPTN